MERETNPMPKFDLFPKLSKVCKFFTQLITIYEHPVPPFMSDHFNKGPAPIEKEVTGSVDLYYEDIH